MPFDYQAAVQAGASYEDIVKFLDPTGQVDTTAALNAGADKISVLNFLSTRADNTQTDNTRSIWDSNIATKAIGGAGDLIGKGMSAVWNFNPGAIITKATSLFADKQTTDQVGQATSNFNMGAVGKLGGDIMGGFTVDKAAPSPLLQGTKYKDVVPPQIIPEGTKIPGIFGITKTLPTIAASALFEPIKGMFQGKTLGEIGNTLVQDIKNSPFYDPKTDMPFGRDLPREVGDIAARGYVLSKILPSVLGPAGMGVVSKLFTAGMAKQTIDLFDQGLREVYQGAKSGNEDVKNQGLQKVLIDGPVSVYFSFQGLKHQQMLKNEIKTATPEVQAELKQYLSPELKNTVSKYITQAKTLFTGTTKEGLATTKLDESIGVVKDIFRPSASEVKNAQKFTFDEPRNWESNAKDILKQVADSKLNDYVTVDKSGNALNTNVGLDYNDNLKVEKSAKLNEDLKSYPYQVEPIYDTKLQKGILTEALKSADKVGLDPLDKQAVKDFMTEYMKAAANEYKVGIKPATELSLQQSSELATQLQRPLTFTERQQLPPNKNVAKYLLAKALRERVYAGAKDAGIRNQSREISRLLDIEQILKRANGKTINRHQADLLGFRIAASIAGKGIPLAPIAFDWAAKKYGSYVTDPEVRMKEALKKYGQSQKLSSMSDKAFPTPGLPVESVRKMITPEQQKMLRDYISETITGKANPTLEANARAFLKDFGGNPKASSMEIAKFFSEVLTTPPKVAVAPAPVVQKEQSAAIKDVAGRTKPISQTYSQANDVMSVLSDYNAKSTGGITPEETVATFSELRQVLGDNFIRQHSPDKGARALNNPTNDTMAGFGIDAVKEIMLEAYKNPNALNELGLTGRQALDIKTSLESKPISAGFVSPNAGVGDNFAQASEKLSSPEHKAALKQFNEINKSNGINSESKSAVGDWGDGSENTTYFIDQGIVPKDTLIYNLAKQASLTNQKQFIWFQEGVGIDYLYKVDITGVNQGQVKSIFDKAGVTNKTIGDNEVLIFNKSGEYFDTKMLGKILEATKGLGLDKSKIMWYKGNGGFKGSWLEGEAARADAQKIYKKIIDTYEQSRGTIQTNGGGTPKSGNRTGKGSAVLRNSDLGSTSKTNGKTKTKSVKGSTNVGALITGGLAAIAGTAGAALGGAVMKKNEPQVPDTTNTTTTIPVKAQALPSEPKNSGVLFGLTSEHINKKIYAMESSSGKLKKQNVVFAGENAWLIGLEKKTYDSFLEGAKRGEQRYIDLLSKIDLSTPESTIQSAYPIMIFKATRWNRQGKAVGFKAKSFEDAYVNYYNASPTKTKDKQGKSPRQKALENFRKNNP